MATWFRAFPAVAGGWGPSVPMVVLGKGRREVVSVGGSVWGLRREKRGEGMQDWVRERMEKRVRRRRRREGFGGHLDRGGVDGLGRMVGKWICIVDIDTGHRYSAY